MNGVRHRTDDLLGQTNGRPLTIDNDRAEGIRMAISSGHGGRSGPIDPDAFGLADDDPRGPLFDPLEQLGDLA